jgi:hypothetical protein
LDDDLVDLNKKKIDLLN